jgi:hypothetical protein
METALAANPTRSGGSAPAALVCHRAPSLVWFSASMALDFHRFPGIEGLDPLRDD